MTPAHDDPGADEPDYRFTLANERTFLAWMRTALALLAAGVAVRELANELGGEAARTVMAVVLVGMSLGLALMSYVRWSRVQTAMRQQRPLPAPVGVPILAIGMAAVGATAAVLLLVG